MFIIASQVIRDEYQTYYWKQPSSKSEIHQQFGCEVSSQFLTESELNMTEHRRLCALSITFY